MQGALFLNIHERKCYISRCSVKPNQRTQFARANGFTPPTYLAEPTKYKTIFC